MDSLKNPTLDHFIDSNIKEFNSREHITKVLDAIMLSENEEGNYKLIKLNRSRKPLGLDNELNLVDGKTTSPLNKGMKFFSFSDGFTDIRNKRGEMFGEDRLEDFIKKNYMLKPDRFISDLLGEVNSYMDGTPQVDDMTTLVLSFLINYLVIVNVYLKRDCCKSLRL